MGFLEIFKKVSFKNNSRELPWILLENKSQLEELESRSEEKLGVLFKHSPRCLVSRMALNMFQKNFEQEWTGRANLYIVDVLKSRAVSKEIEERFGIRHESPQLILLKDGKVVLHRSHSGIAARSITSFL